MKVVNVDLKKEYALEGGQLTCILNTQLNEVDPTTYANLNRPALIVVPGGAYNIVSEREAENVAIEFLAKGFQTFVLTYSTAKEGKHYPQQFLQLACAVDYVKKHAKELCVNEKQIFAIGFSAGGHLVGNMAVDWQNASTIYGKTLDAKPTAVGLCYPVITNTLEYKNTHKNLLEGYEEKNIAKLLQTLNLDQAVSSLTPPSYIWTTAEDEAVPCENALVYALACAKNKVPYELHVYPKGPHGVSTGKKDVNPDFNDAYVTSWIEECTTFFKRFIEE